MGLAQDVVWWVWLGVHTWAGLGVRPRLMWGCCMAALCPAQWLWLYRGATVAVVGGGSSHYSQQLLWQGMSAPCSTLHTL